MTVPGKGLGVFAAASFDKDSYLCEYTGELITAKEGYLREKQLTDCSNVGNLLFFFIMKESTYGKLHEVLLTYCENVCALFQHRCNQG